MASFLHVGFFYTTVLLGGIRLTWAFIMVPISRIPLDRRYGAHLLQRWASDVDSGPQSLGIVGGGLAGLATTFYALQRQLLDENPNSSHLQTITVWDRHAVGTGGASAVAGGLVHPLSPRGKLVYRGLECLAATQELVEEAVRWSDPAEQEEVVLGREILRLALTDTQINQLLATRDSLSKYCTWLEASDLPPGIPKNVLGGLKIHRGGCLVLHVPSYLRGLWRACKRLAEQGNVQLEFRICEASQSLVDAIDWSNYDTVVLAAGAGLLQEPGLWRVESARLPVQLVRGQSIEMKVLDPLPAALLCGKYVSPLPGDRRVLVGATHEFKDNPLPVADVTTTLRNATAPFYDWPDDEGVDIERITSGYRVQSQRGPRGRRPLLGPISADDGFPHHDNAYIYTGLSSRGLLYHAYYARALVHQIMGAPGKDALFDAALTTEDWHWWRSR